jgi:dCTP diphosphatase
MSEAKSDANTTVQELIEAVAAFRDARDWAQFHAPKNLSMAIAIEAAELMEQFQWVDVAESRAVLQEGGSRTAVAEELADVLLYCFSLASMAGFDLSTILRRKMAANAEKYPVERYTGRYR